MKELNTMTLDELKALEAEIKTAKANLKETAKANKASLSQTAIDNVNAMITNGDLKTGMKVVILYGSKNEELVGEIVGVLSTDKATLTINSLDFNGKVDEKGEKRRYIAKDRFVRVYEG